MKTVKIEEATGPQLVAFAQTILNIEGVRASMSKADMIAKIRTVGYDKDTIEVEAQARPTEEDAGKPSEDKVTLMIPSSDLPGGADAVPVGVNGSVMLIPRDQWCDVPRRYYQALRDAVRQVYSPLPDGGISAPRDVPAYPFQVRA